MKIKEYRVPQIILLFSLFWFVGFVIFIVSFLSEDSIINKLFKLSMGLFFLFRSLYELKVVVGERLIIRQSGVLYYQARLLLKPKEYYFEYHSIQNITWNEVDVINRDDKMKLIITKDDCKYEINLCQFGNEEVIYKEISDLWSKNN